jgi:hypothetical protein
MHMIAILPVAVIMAVIIARKADKQYAEQTKKDPAPETRGF